MQRNNFYEAVKNFIRRDFERKIIALVLALLLYLAINHRISEKRERSFQNVPVNVSLPSELFLNNRSAMQVKVTLSGNAEALDEIDPAALRISCEVYKENFIPGSPYRLHLRSSDVSGLVYGVKVEAVSPRELALELEPVISKKVPIRARYDSSDKMPQDYEISSTRFVPSHVMLSGPAQVMNSIQEVYTAPIPIDEQVTESFEYISALRIPSKTRSDFTECEARVEVVKAMTTHTFRSVPLLIVQSAKRARNFQVSHLEPETVTVIAGGPRGTLARMHSREINASISLDNIDKAGTYNLPITITITNPSRELSVKSFQPTTAKVLVKQE